MGEKLIEISNDLPEVRGARDKKKIDGTKLIIQRKAKDCYHSAYNLGHPQAYSKYVMY